MADRRAPAGARLAFAPDVVLQVIGGDTLILKLEQEDVFSLNESGTRIAQLIAQGMDVDAIASALCREYGADRQDIARDIEDLVDALVARGLLVLSVDGAG
jgi:hypothetical protein